MRGEAHRGTGGYCRHRRGTILVEALIGLVMLGSAGAALLALLGQTARTIRDVRATERTVDSAAVELDRLVLLDRAALRARAGWSTRGSWAIHVERVAPALFDVIIARNGGAVPVLQTTLYRSDSSDAR